MATTKHTTRQRRRTGDATVREEDDAIDDALRILEARARVRGELIEDLSTAADWFRLKLGALPAEVFAVAWLDRNYRLIAFNELFNGTLDRVNVHIREVVRFALQHNASAALFAHNHPSGNAWPSEANIAITTNLVDMLYYMDITLLDHFIITAEAPPFSMARHGMVVGNARMMRAKKYTIRPSRGGTALYCSSD